MYGVRENHQPKDGMMKGRIFVSMFVFALGFAWAGLAYGQEEHYGNRPWELNVHGGAHFWDDNTFGEGADTDFGAGARIFMNMPSGWGFGGNFDWIAANTDFDGEDFDVTVYYYSGEIEYTFPAGGRIHPFLGVGAGAATVKISDVPEGFDDSETELLVPIAGGVKWFGSSGSWALRAEVRDNIIFISGDEDLGVEDETTNNFEVSGGISFLLGGGM
jgi:opacity protein-like surface antigen